VKRLLAVLLFVSSLAAAQRTADDWYASGVTAFNRGQFINAEAAFERAVALNPTAANWRWLGEARVRLKDYDGATTAFSVAIAKYRASGDVITANALQNRTNPYRQELEVYLLGQPVTPEKTLARLEPASGLLLGAYVNETGITSSDEVRLTRQLGSGLAVYFRYHKLIRAQDATLERQVFPTRLASAARKAGAALHLALEPNMPLAQVSEAVLSGFAQQARDSAVPVFVRFASEFNDPQNPWGANPELYKEKFRLAANVIRRIAPNAAMVWMPMASRYEVIERYYPGKAFVDWAGLSLYSPPYANGKLTQSNLRVSPLDAIAPFYARFAPHHPIQISEYASSHETTLTPDVDHSRFAATKLRLLYWGAMLRFPRLKSINWLDVDMIRSRFVTPSRAASRRNNYSLFTSPAKLEAFRELLTDPYFLRDPRLGSATRPVQLSSLPANRADLEIGAWVKAFEPFIDRVEYRLDGQFLGSSDRLPYRQRLPELSRGTKRLEVRAFNDAGKVVLSRVQNVTVR
jgi:Glycosyl hydrolase family 26